MDLIKRKQVQELSYHKKESLLGKWLKKRFVIGRYSYSYGKTVVMLFVFGLITTVFYFSVYQYYRFHQDPNLIAQREIKSITKKIGKFMELPQEEEPTLATVNDRSKLEGKQFFANAQNGDKVLIYAKFQKAILYRPSTGKIIEVANITSGSRNSLPTSLNSSSRESLPPSP